MTIFERDATSSTASAIRIAKHAVDGEYDLLLACRDLASLNKYLPKIPDDIMDTFVAVASEMDGLPIGDERLLWSAEKLSVKDIQVNSYRARVRDVVMETLKELIAELEEK